MGTNDVPRYDGDPVPYIQSYGTNSNDQSNALGFDESVDLQEGQIKKYTWLSSSTFSDVITSSPAFADYIIGAASRCCKYGLISIMQILAPQIINLRFL